MLILNEIIHYIYFILAGAIGFLLLRNLFLRKTRKTLVYDIVYVYCLIPFLLRILYIK